MTRIIQNWMMDDYCLFFYIERKMNYCRKEVEETAFILVVVVNAHKLGYFGNRD